MDTPLGAAYGNAKLRIRSPPRRPLSPPPDATVTNCSPSTIRRRRREDPGVGVELPQLFACFGVEGKEIAGYVAAGSHEHHTTGGHDDPA